MEMKEGMSQRAELGLKTSYYIVQTMRFLQMPLIELQQFVQQELETNPVLEVVRSETGTMDVYELENSLQQEKSDSEDLLESLTESERWEGNLTGIKGSFSVSDEETQILANIPEKPPPLEEYLLEQLAVHSLTDKELKIIKFLIFNLDQDGYLRASQDSLLNNFNRGVKNAVDLVIKEIDKHLVDNNLTSENIASCQQLEKTVDGILQVNSLWKYLSSEEAFSLIERYLRDKDKINEFIDSILANDKDIENAINLLQSLDPPGIGARSFAECLILQLDKNDKYYDEKRRIIEYIVNNKVPLNLKDISNNLSIKPEIIKSILEEMKSLTLSPVTRFLQTQKVPIIPDIIVKPTDGDYAVLVNRANIPQIRINKDYLKLVSSKSLDKETKDFLKSKIQTARSLTRAISERQLLLLIIAQEIVKEQREFLDKGVFYLKPMTLETIAKKVDLHNSTVSRAIVGKYIETPRGIFSVRFFFSRTAGSLSRFRYSKVSIQQRIKEIVSSESGKKPLSDKEIAKLLEKEGIKLARRTVAKYREELGIPSTKARVISKNQISSIKNKE